MADFPYPLTPEQAAELDRAKAYYSGPQPDAGAPLAPMPGGIDPSWLNGNAPPPGVGLPPVGETTPGALFGGPPAPAPPPPPQTLESGIRAAFPTAPSAPTPDPVTPVRQPVSFDRSTPGLGAEPGEIGPPQKRYGPDDFRPKPVATARSSADPFGLEAARKSLRGTFDADKGALAAGANADKARADILANGAATAAREKEEDAAIQRLESEQAAKRFQEYSDETQRQIDAVKSTQIGSRLYQDGGSKALAIIGGIFGGMYQGLNHTASNPFIDQMNKNIDRDIAIQEKNLENQKQSVAERRGVLADLRNTFKDDQLAKLQARNLYYEAFKDQIAAEAAQYDSPLIQSKADMAIDAVSREQSKLDIEGAKTKAAAAQAAAAAALARQEHARKAALEERAMRVQEGRLLVDANEAQNKAGKGASEQLEKLSAAIAAKPELAASKKIIADVEKKLVNPETGEIDGTRRVPGTGTIANLKDAWWNTPLIGAQNPIPGLHLTDEERVGRQDWDRLALAYQNAVTGSGGSDREAERIHHAFMGANTPAEQANAIRIAKAMLTEHESRIYAGYPKEVVEEYKRRTAEENASVPRTARRFAP